MACHGETASTGVANSSVSRACRRYALAKSTGAETVGRSSVFEDERERGGRPPPALGAALAAALEGALDGALEVFVPPVGVTRPLLVEGTE